MVDGTSAAAAAGELARSCGASGAWMLVQVTLHHSSADSAVTKILFCNRFLLSRRDCSSPFMSIFCNVLPEKYFLFLFFAVPKSGSLQV